MHSNATASGGCEKVVESLQNELEVQQRRMSKPISALTQVESTKSYSQRAGKSHSNIQQQISELKEQEAIVAKDLEETRARLKTLEAEAAKSLSIPKGPVSAAEGLEEALRMLMVTLHACSLPTPAAEAVEEVRKFIPVHEQTSDDRGDDGEMVDADAVDAGKLNAALAQDISAERAALLHRLSLLEEMEQRPNGAQIRGTSREDDRGRHRSPRRATQD